jgi:NitT/TauT family transport system substrate-binding protein
MSTMNRREFLRHGRPVAAVAATMALAPRALQAQTPPVPQPIPLRFSLDWKLEGPSAMFLVPQERGYFRHEGLDVAIDEGSGSLEPITRVASGSHDLGFADINMLVKHRDQNPTAPVKAIFMVYNKPPFSIVSRKSRGITEPKHLEGKKLGAPPAGSTFGEWPLFARLNDIDLAKVSVEQIGIPVRAPMLAAGQIDAALGYSFRVYVDLKDRGVPVDDIVLLQMADYGLWLYGSTIIVNSKVASEKPDAVKGFLRALLRGLRDTIRNPGTAVDVLLKRDDSLKREVEVERLRMAIRDNIVTQEVRTNGFGAVDMGRLDTAITQIGLTHNWKAKPRGVDIFDSSFLPPLTERRPS